MDTLVGLVSIAGFFFLLLILVLCSYQLRRRKYRRIANELGAQYQSQGLFNSGKIAGAINQRTYTVETVDRGRGGTWTTIKMQCVNKGIPLHIHGHFFKPFPNWKYAFKLGDRTERVFFTHITLQNVGILLEEKYRVGVQSLFQEFAFLNYGFLRKGHLGIDQDSVVFTIRGALRKLDVVQQILSVLARVADRIEAAPVL
jgi:hypothetical protein